MTRLLSCGLALLALLAALPMAAVIALLVSLESQGPVLVAEWWVAPSGRRVRTWRFRTAAVGTNEPTRVGWVLRRWSLQELPVLLSVVRGDIGLVDAAWAALDRER